MNLLFGILAFIVAFAMRRYGVKISHISLFGIGPVLFTFHLRRWFGETPITIRLIPIAAFVKPADKNYADSLSYMQQLHIFAAGIAVNMIEAGLMYGILMFGWGTVTLLGCAIVLGYIAIGLFPRVAAFVSIPAGLYVIVKLAMVIIEQGNAAFVRQNGSVVAMSQDFVTYSVSFAEMGMLVYMLFSGLALLNSLPLLPFDGGRIVLATIQKLFPKGKIAQAAFMMVSVVCLLYLFGTAIGGDVVRVVDMFK